MQKRTQILLEILERSQRTCFSVDSEVYEICKIEKQVNKLKKCYGIVEVKKLNDEVIIVSRVK